MCWICFSTPNPAAEVFEKEPLEFHQCLMASSKLKHHNLRLENFLGACCPTNTFAPTPSSTTLVVLKILKAGMWFVSSLRGQKSLQIGFWEQSSYWPVLSQRSLLLCWIWYLDRILQGCMVWAHLGSSFREISKQKMPSVDVMGVADIPSELSTCLWVAKRFD